jgi:hypothetical protein
MTAVGTAALQGFRLRVGQEEHTMFSGTIIDELMAAVARAEENAESELKAEEAYSMLAPEYQAESALAGVA